MSAPINGINNSNSMFMDMWEKATRNIKKTEKSDQEKGMELFGKALDDVNKASDRMMDDHLESVAKSAKEQAEYRKKKAVQEKAEQSAEDMKLFAEQALLNRINQRAMMSELRGDEEERRNLLR
ncbi:hypothetical protein FACS1894167_09580 [Synergistales bacterium]|nr:hypothetical protein FACS1894167_09580 [Synergistales bacterium]GHV53899.1 hypothetical protein FACS1894216_12780 [Synergistales bacterium]